jgi:hypothetical protein
MIKKRYRCSGGKCMDFCINEYKERIENFYEIMKQNEDIVSIKLSEDKWTLKEMVSHLIDSASNNHQRFIRLQLESKINFPTYEAEEWKNKTRINEYNFFSLINFWKEYNYYLLHIIENIETNKLENIWETGEKQLTLKFIIKDYFEGHMDWHIDLYKKRIDEIINGFF